MDKLEARLNLLTEAKKRMKSLSFGDPVTNVCAGDGNPHRHSWFVEYKVKTHRNRYGINHSEHFAKCTDRKGRFWETDIEVIYEDHLDYQESKKIYAPIHDAHF